MIWKMHKNRKIRSLCLGLFLFACCSFFGCLSSLKASAVATNINSVNAYRSYFHSGIGSPTLQENAGSHSIPYTILSFDSDYYKLLYNIIPSTYIGDNDTSSKYKTLLVNFVFKQESYMDSTNPMDYNDNAIMQITSHNSSNNNVVTNAICNAPEKARYPDSTTPYPVNTNYMSITCSYQFSNYSAIDAFSLTIGTTDYSAIQNDYYYGDWAYVGEYRKIAPNTPGYNTDLILYSASYELKKTDDPLIAGQDLIIDINSSILSSFESIKQQEELDRHNLSDLTNQNNIDASDAGNAATQANTPLFSAITTIYGYLLYPSPSNCVIGPVSIYNMNLGNLDFCTGFDIPQPLIAIGGLAMIGLVLALCFAVLHSAISLYREFLGGGK